MLENLRPPRRAVIVGAGLGALATAVAACSSDDESATAESSTAASASPSSSAAAAPGGGALAKTADVPVGSGLIVDDVVITQATAGDFKGFSSVCPHAGCHVNRITDGKIICPCHNSEFNLDGTVARGPAKQPLESKAVSVQGASIVAG